MKTIPKIAALLVLGLAGVPAANANTTDLLLGFNDAAGPSTAQNDYVIDLGLSGQTLISDALASPGSTYDLSGDFSAGTFNTAFGSDASDLNHVAVGVVGSETASPKYLFQTDPIGEIPAAIFSGQFNDASASAGSISIGEYGSSSGSGWSAYVAVSPTEPGTLSGTSGDDVADQSGNPLGQLASGSLSLNLWEVSKTGSTVGSWLDEGTFNINLNSDTVSFTAAPVPEPSASLYVLGGLFMLGVVLRRQFGRLNG